MLKSSLRAWVLAIGVLAGPLLGAANAQTDAKLDRWIAEVAQIGGARYEVYFQGSYQTALALFEEHGVGQTFTPEELQRWVGVTGRNLNAVSNRSSKTYDNAYHDLRAWARALRKGHVTAHEVEAALGPAMADFRVFDRIVQGVLDRTISKRLRWANYMEARRNSIPGSKEAKYNWCMAKFSLEPREKQTEHWIRLRLIPPLPGQADANGEDARGARTAALVGQLEAIVADPDRFGEEALLAALQATKLNRNSDTANAVLVLEDLVRRMEYEQEDLDRLPALLAEAENAEAAAEISQRMSEALLLRVTENAASYVQTSDDPLKALKRVNSQVKKAMKLYANTHGGFSTSTKIRVSTAIGGLLSLPGVIANLQEGGTDASDLLSLAKALGAVTGAKIAPAPLAAAATAGVLETSAEGFDVASQALDLLPAVMSGDADAAAKLDVLVAEIQDVLSVENYVKSAGVETINTFIGSIPFLNAFIRKIIRTDLGEGFGSQRPIPC